MVKKNCSVCSGILRSLEKPEKNDSVWDILPALAIIAIIPASLIVFSVIYPQDISNA